MAIGVDHPAYLRVAYLDETSQMGGAEHLLLTLLQGIRSLQIEPLLVCRGHGPLLEEAGRRGIRTVLLPIPPLLPVSWRLSSGIKILNPLAIAWDIAAVLIASLQLTMLLVRNRVHLIQSNYVFSHIYGGIAARLLRIPCIWYFHDYVEVDRLWGLVSLLWRCLSRCLATRVVAVSQAVLNSLCVGSRGLVIYAGVPMVDSSTLPALTAQLGLPDHVKLVGYVGRITWSKGLDLLLQSAAKIVSQNTDIHFVLFGEASIADAIYKHSLSRRVGELGLTSHWHWMGYSRHAARYIKQFDILVLPTRREALSLVLIEAGLAGKAVVASRVGGVSEVVVNQETGILVCPNNERELTCALEQLIRAPSYAYQLGLSARQRTQRLFGLSRFYEQFSDLYLSVVQAPRRLA